jgi:enamine deaminase RidA (YjgF/YER057c/UK114 family)
MARQLIGSNTPWETIVGYSRAVRVGDFIAVAGTTASDEHGTTQAVGDAYGQAMYTFEKIERALLAAGATRASVIRTRLFVTDIGQWEAFGRAHRDFFGDVYPAATMVEVTRLQNPDHLIEIEVDAIVEAGGTEPHDTAR